MTYWLLLMAMVVAILFWLRRYRKKTKPGSRAEDVRNSSKYHCITITCGDNACEAVKRLEGKRFLSAEAPVLRLRECTAESCQCRYVHYDDRREEERRNPYGRYRSITPFFLGQERRMRSGRRNADIVELDVI